MTSYLVESNALPLPAGGMETEATCAAWTPRGERSTIAAARAWARECVESGAQRARVFKLRKRSPIGPLVFETFKLRWAEAVDAIQTREEYRAAWGRYGLPIALSFPEENGSYFADDHGTPKAYMPPMRHRQIFGKGRDAQ